MNNEKDRCFLRAPKHLKIEKGEKRKTNEEKYIQVEKEEKGQNT